jgi:hypothetical protein
MTQNTVVDVVATGVVRQVPALAPDGVYRCVTCGSKVLHVSISGTLSSAPQLPLESMTR